MIINGKNLEFWPSNVTFNSFENWERHGDVSIVADNAVISPGGSINQMLSSTSNGLSASMYRKIILRFEITGGLDETFNFMNRITIGFIYTYNHSDGSVHRNHGTIVVTKRNSVKQSDGSYIYENIIPVAAVNMLSAFVFIANNHPIKVLTVKSFKMQRTKDIANDQFTEVAQQINPITDVLEHNNGVAILLSFTKVPLYVQDVVDNDNEFIGVRWMFGENTTFINYGRRNTDLPITSKK